MLSLVAVLITSVVLGACGGGDDERLPSPVVITGWGRQLRLQSVGDPRLHQFVLRYAGQGPEVNGPCS